MHIEVYFKRRTSFAFMPILEKGKYSFCRHLKLKGQTKVRIPLNYLRFSFIWKFFSLPIHSFHHSKFVCRQEGVNFDIGYDCKTFITCLSYNVLLVEKRNFDTSRLILMYFSFPFSQFFVTRNGGKKYGSKKQGSVDNTSLKWESFGHFKRSEKLHDQKCQFSVIFFVNDKHTAHKFSKLGKICKIATGLKIEWCLTVNVNVNHWITTVFE